MRREGPALLAGKGVELLLCSWLVGDGFSRVRKMGRASAADILAKPCQIQGRDKVQMLRIRGGPLYKQMAIALRVHNLRMHVAVA